MIKFEDSVIHKETASKINPLDKVFSSWCLLHELSESSIDISLCKSSTVESGDISITLLFENMPIDILNTLPIPDHEIYSFDEGMELFNAKFQSAIKIVDQNLNSSLRGITSFSKVFAPVKLKHDSNEKLITSLTIPDLPFMSFISKNAFFHLAPDVIRYGYEEYYLAENIFHEMIHNYINIILLEKDVFIEEYSSTNSPKIEIPWRKDAEVRNQSWELDRMIHAYFVYKYLSIFRGSLSRIKESGIDSKIVEDSIKKNIFLKQKILENKNMLTSHGIDFIQLF